MTSSRYRDNVATTFDVFCEIAAPNKGEELGTILLKYPDDFGDSTIMKSISQFAFPCDMKNTSDSEDEKEEELSKETKKKLSQQTKKIPRCNNSLFQRIKNSPEEKDEESESEAVQLYSFVLTDSNSRYSFGYCRYTPRNDTCLCLLSGYFWPNVFYKILNEFSIIMNNDVQSNLDQILHKIYHAEVPLQGDVIRIPIGTSGLTIEATVPFYDALPSLRKDKYMLEYYNIVDIPLAIDVYSSLLKERRILFTGKKLSTLSSCVHACSMLLYPMCWQYVFIPVLPAVLKEMVSAPMPYLIGIPKQTLEKIPKKELEDVCIVDVDTKKFRGEFGDASKLPNELLTYLRNQLKVPMDMDDSFARIFLRANIILFGDYRSGLARGDRRELIWRKEKFIGAQKLSYQPYLASLLGTDGVQYLERFFHEKLEMVKKGIVINDEFEREIEAMDLKHRPVRDNASDVFGALKEKVSGIQIANRLTRFNPRELRRVTSRNKVNRGVGARAMSFDNLQWERVRDEHHISAPLELQGTITVPTGNLIDFESPVREERPAETWNEFLRPNSFTTNLNIPSTSNAIFRDPFSPSDTPRSSSSASTSSSMIPAPPPPPPNRSNWERFD